MHPDHNEFIKHYLRWLVEYKRTSPSKLETKGDCARAFNKEVEYVKEHLGKSPLTLESTMKDLDRLTINLEQAQNVPWRVFASRMKYLLENY